MGSLLRTIANLLVAQRWTAHALVSMSFPHKTHRLINCLPAFACLLFTTGLLLFASCWPRCLPQRRMCKALLGLLAGSLRCNDPGPQRNHGDIVGSQLDGHVCSHAIHCRLPNAVGNVENVVWQLPRAQGHMQYEAGTRSSFNKLSPRCSGRRRTPH